MNKIIKYVGASLVAVFPSLAFASDFGTMPAPSTFFDDIAAWSNPLFGDMFVYVEYAVGILVAMGLLYFVIHIGAMIFHGRGGTH